MLVDEKDPSPPSKDPPHIFCLSMTADEDTVLRELSKAGDELPSDARGTAPSLRRNLAATISVENLYGCIDSLRQMGYVETTMIAQTDQWLRHYRPIKVCLTERGRRHVLTKAPVNSGTTTTLIYIAVAGVLIAVLQDIVGDPAYGTVGMGMFSAAVISLVARRAGKFFFGKN
jgi:hypothetical protein